MEAERPKGDVIGDLSDAEGIVIANVLSSFRPGTARLMNTRREAWIGYTELERGNPGEIPASGGGYIANILYSRDAQCNRIQRIPENSTTLFVMSL